MLNAGRISTRCGDRSLYQCRSKGYRQAGHCSRRTRRGGSLYPRGCRSDSRGDKAYSPPAQNLTCFSKTTCLSNRYGCAVKSACETLSALFLSIPLPKPTGSRCFLKPWIREKKRGSAPTSLKLYKQAAALLLKFLGPRAVTLPWKKSLAASREHSSGSLRRYIHQDLEVLRQATKLIQPLPKI